MRGDIDVASFRDDERESARDAHHAKRGDERRQLDEHDEERGEQAGGQTNEDAGADTRSQSPLIDDKQVTGDHAGQRDHRAGREIDAA